MLRCVTVVALAGLLGMAGCEKPAASGGTTGGPTTPPTPAAPAGVTRANIVGDWVIDPADYADYAQVFVLRMMHERGQTVTPAEVAEGVAQISAAVAEEPPVLTFNEDGVFALRVGAGNGLDGTWALDGSVVSISVEGGASPGSFRYADGKMVSVLQVEGELEATLIRKP